MLWDTILLGNNLIKIYSKDHDDDSTDVKRSDASPDFIWDILRGGNAFIPGALVSKDEYNPIEREDRIKVQVLIHGFVVIFMIDSSDHK